MTSKEALDVAMNLADKAQKHIQFFILICTAFGGWVLVSENTFSKLECGLMVLVFSISTGGVLLGELSILQKLNAALFIAHQKFAVAESKILDEALPLFEITSIRGAKYSMGAAIIVIDIVLATAWMR